MVLGNRYKLQDAHFLNLIIDNHDVKHSSQQKLLGLHIDDKLSFTSHIDVLRFHRKYHFYGLCQHMKVWRFKRNFIRDIYNHLLTMDP